MTLLLIEIGAHFASFLEALAANRPEMAFGRGLDLDLGGHADGLAVLWFSALTDSANRILGHAIRSPQTGDRLAFVAMTARRQAILVTASMASRQANFVGFNFVRQPEAGQHHPSEAHTEPLKRLPPCN